MSSITPLNVIYLHSHDTGRYVEPYGYAVKTPRIQRLAEEGVLFRQAFSAAPTCSPSRAALLTGETPHQAGMIGLAHRGFCLADPSRHLAHRLKDAGYRTVLAGMQHLTEGDQAQLGYTDDLRPTSLAVADVAPIAASVIEAHAGDGAPLFLDVGFEETHRPFHGANSTDPRYVLPPDPLPNTSETRRDMADYLGSARELDRGVGIVLDAIGRASLADSTLVICTTDHGLAFPGMKSNLTDHGIGVMLIMRGQQGFTGGRVVDALVSHLDLYPTLCEMLSFPCPTWVQGRSLLPLIHGEQSQIRDEIHAEVTFHAAYEPQRAVRTSRWLYIRRFGAHEFPVLANVNESPSRDLWLEHNWEHRHIDAEQLYDLILDPIQRCNLFGTPEVALVQSELQARLERWMRETDDPLLRGDVPLPRGALMNDPKARSADEPLIMG
ncbi:MAG TPA: sulfatase [Thermomicrobiales bacterium]|nr:sulfatase [Thermomicrobiales bacterium]